MALHSRLSKAAASLAAHDGVSAVPHLISAWQVCRAAPIAELIDRLTRMLGARTHYRAGWIELQLHERPEKLYRHLRDANRRAVGGGKLFILEDCDDPRVAAAFLGLLAEPATVRVGRDVERAWGELINTLAVLGDRRAIEPLEALSARYPEVMPNPTGEWIQRALATAADALRNAPLPPELTVEEASLCEQMATQLSNPSWAAQASERLRSERDVYRAIAENPDDDAARLVYADWLSERNDPHGELIHLQLLRPSGALNAEQAARETELLEAGLLDFGRTRWLGELAFAIPVWLARFERGFPTAICVPEQIDRVALETVIGNFRWAAARDLTFTDWSRSPELFVALLSHPVMRGVRRLSGPDLAALLALTREAPVPYRFIELSDYRPQSAPLLELLAQRPEVKVLGLKVPQEPGTWAELLRAPETMRLERLVLTRMTAERFAEWFSILEDSAVRRFDLQSFTSPYWVDQPEYNRLSFERDVSGRFSILRLEGGPLETWSDVKPFQMVDVLPLLAALKPDALTRFSLAAGSGTVRRPTADELNGLREALRRFRRLELLELPEGLA
jgi:uncharacterized protein (TIGR02996 family)